ncbi:MAG TPA: ATP-dependent DNA helicase [Chitinophagaceae bacterium]|nr:ATP-dependent DNA helicase [Chitinophagaceae bacterium]
MGVYRESLSTKFRDEYFKLNKEQRKAVDTIEGPVMVIAGPGTGKTQILAARIGKILLDTDADPSNILCLTYTDAGVIAMRKRLQEFIGPDAYKVNIYTFHAFCNDVIQENLSLFERNTLDPVSELERIEYLRELIDRLPKNHPLKRYRGDAYFEIRNLQLLFSTMKREGWTPVFLNEKIDEYLDDLHNREEFIYKRAYKHFKAGDRKLEKIKEEEERMEKIKAAVNEFEAFQQMMKSKGRYDFDDMINWVIRAFEQNKNLLARYQEQFLYLLVDEYQDTSGTQNQLVELLINYWDKPNVFVVGDDDQSIFRFQGASVENMLVFARTYAKDLMKVVLRNNYRSTQSILDLSLSLIERNEKRLINQMAGLTKELISSNPKYRAQSIPPVIKEYETTRHEMIDITMQVKDLLDRNIPAGRIAVIYKENKYGEELMEYFRLQQIPFYSKRSLDILQIPLAQKVITIFEYLDSEHEIPYSGDQLLFEILHFDFFNIPPIEIAKLSVEVAGRQFTENKTSLRKLLNEKAHQPPKDLFSQGLNEKLKKASVILEKLIAIVPNVTLQSLFEYVIREGGVVGSIMLSPDKNWQLQVLNGLFDFVKQETRRNPSLTLKQLARVIELMQKEGLVLPLVQVSGNDKGVNLLTAHGSKGLEFEWVFFAGCHSSIWEKKRKPGSGYTLPNTVFQSFSSEIEEEELRRLFYVVLTRAEQHLSISYSKFNGDGRELEPSMFIAEIQSGIPPEKVYLLEDTVAEFQALHFTEVAPELKKIESDFVSRLLEKFVMNVTALNNYLKCPLEFYFVNLVKIPRPKNEAIEFGSAVHSALEQLFRQMVESATDNYGRFFPSQKSFIESFEWYMKRHRESFTPEQFNRRMEYGQEVLSNYYSEYINKWNKVVAIERNIRNVVVKEVPLKGKLDKLEFDGKRVNIVDYKTGDPEKARIKLQPPNEKDPNGGDYWRQAVFYKLLVDHTERGWDAVSTEFDFIEPDKKKKYRKEKVVISPQDIETVSQQISFVWQKIQDHDFYTGCGKPDCHWCNFVKTNNLAVALHEIVEEEPQE